MTNSSLHKLLQQYFGYSSFRPLQEEIIRDVLDKKDVFVLMPTGGGKSLCFQLPAILQDGITIVVSPLIALMKDQVDNLQKNGIAAAFFNSTLSLAEQSALKAALLQNKIKLLYVAPERLMQDSFIEFLQKLPIRLFAIDEAHCISEWGHDFRAEYRQLSLLKKVFMHIPVIALTATATQRVKADIVQQLSLHNPSMYQGSFNRSNLHYKVQPKTDLVEQVIEYIKHRPGESGIVYCARRDTVDQLADALQREEIRALPYHAGLEELRAHNQEKFVREDADVIVATIAFGMGIDKPNVRYIIHADLPKNIEQYYQETGRAGRDGLPSECLLLFSYADKEKAEYFIRQKEDVKEQEIAYGQLSQILNFAQHRRCRRHVLLAYFGEEFTEENCGACDNCLQPPEIVDATVLVQKILSCVYHLHGKFGATHIAQILTGSKTKRLLGWGHNQLSTYGIVKEYSAHQLKEYIGELLSLGYLEKTNEQYPTISLANKAIPVLKGKEQVFLSKPHEDEIYIEKDSGSETMNGQLFDHLRRLRKRIADKEGVPPYVIFADTSLIAMSTYFPQTIDQFSHISGVGEHKLRLYADKFIKEIEAYCGPKNIVSIPVPKKRKNR